MQTVKMINGNSFTKKVISDEKIRDFKSLKEISIILESEKIDRLELGLDFQKFNQMISSLEILSNYRKVFQTEWQKVFLEPTDFSLLKKIMSNNPLDFIQMEFIKRNGYDKKLDFVKREKLVEIVDFPDFGILISSIQKLFDLQSDPVFRVISFEDAFAKALSTYPDSYEKKIRESCEIVLKGAVQIQNYLWVNLLFLASNKVKDFFSNPDYDRFSEKIYDKGIITNQPGEAYLDYRINKERLLNILMRGE